MSKISIRFYNDRELRAIWEEDTITCTNLMLLLNDWKQQHIADVF